MDSGAVTKAVEHSGVRLGILAGGDGIPMQDGGNLLTGDIVVGGEAATAHTLDNALSSSPVHRVAVPLAAGRIGKAD